MKALSSLFAEGDYMNIDLDVPSPGCLILLTVSLSFIYETDRLFYYFIDFSFTFLQNLR